MIFFGSPEALADSIVDTLMDAVVELDPDKRYLVLVHEPKEEEMKAFIRAMDEVLDLNNSNLRMVITDNPVRILEF